MLDRNKKLKSANLYKQLNRSKQKKLVVLMRSCFRCNLVCRIGSGAMIIIIGIAARWLDLHAKGNKYWLSLCNHEMKKPKFPLLFHLQVRGFPYPLLA